MTKAAYVIGSGIGGAIGGVIGGVIAANSYDHPVLKASLGTGAIYAGLAMLLVAADAMKFDEPAGTLSGPPQLKVLGFP